VSMSSGCVQLPQLARLPGRLLIEKTLPSGTMERIAKALGRDGGRVKEIGARRSVRPGSDRADRGILDVHLIYWWGQFLSNLYHAFLYNFDGTYCGFLWRSPVHTLYLALVARG
jgi:hypothetical protein